MMEPSEPFDAVEMVVVVLTTLAVVPVQRRSGCGVVMIGEVRNVDL